MVDKSSKKAASDALTESGKGKNGESEDRSNEVSPRNTLNDLTAKEWIPETVSVWSQKGLGAKHPDAQIERQHPAPFSFTDVSRLVRFFTKKGQTVLDPFVGIGSTLKACALCGRKGIGIELNPKYVSLTKTRLEKELEPQLFPVQEQKVLQGDSREVLDDLEPSSVDYIVTSPPYWCILHKEDHKVRQERKSKNLDSKYSSDPKDLGNIDSYTEFLHEVVSVFLKCFRVLKNGKYLSIIVGDFRDKGKYHMFHSDLAVELEKHGFQLKGITILYQRHKRIFPYGYPTAYVPNLHHQYILNFQKPKSRKKK